MWNYNRNENYFKQTLLSDFFSYMQTYTPVIHRVKVKKLTGDNLVGAAA